MNQKIQYSVTATLINPSCIAQEKNQSISSRIVVLNQSMIDVNHSQHFVMANLFGNAEDELVTFDTISYNSTNVTLYCYYNGNWKKVLSQLLGLDGTVFMAHKIQFHHNHHQDNDNHHNNDHRQDNDHYRHYNDNHHDYDSIIVGCRLGKNHFSTIYMLDFKCNSFKFTDIYNSTQDFIFDFAVVPKEPKILLLMEEITNMTQYINKVEILDLKNGSIVPIYQTGIDYDKIAIGNFVSNFSVPFEIILADQCKNVIMLDNKGHVLAEPKTYNFLIAVRQIIPWDINNTGVDQLVCMESSYVNNQSGYFNQVLIVNLNHNITVQQITIKVNKLLKQIDIGCSGCDKNDNLFILDPNPGYVFRYDLAFDGRGQSYWLWCVNVNDPAGSKPVFCSIYSDIMWGVNIDAQLVHYLTYNSNYSDYQPDSYDLLNEIIHLYQTPTGSVGTRMSDCADVVIGMTGTLRTDENTVLGRSASDLVTRAGIVGTAYTIYADLTSSVMAHETGILFGLSEDYNPSDWWYVMYYGMGEAWFFYGPTVFKNFDNPDYYQNHRDYTIPTPTITCDGNYWTISSGSIPTGWIIGAGTDWGNKNEITVSNGGSTFTIPVPNQTGTYTLTVTVCDWAGNIVWTGTNTQTVSPPSGGGGSPSPSTPGYSLWVMGVAIGIVVIAECVTLQKRKMREPIAFSVT